jgi:hypothetical protein
LRSLGRSIWRWRDPAAGDPRRGSLRDAGAPLGWRGSFGIMIRSRLWGRCGTVPIRPSFDGRRMAAMSVRRTPKEPPRAARDWRCQEILASIWWHAPGRPCTGPCPRRMAVMVSEPGGRGARRRFRRRPTPLRQPCPRPNLARCMDRACAGWQIEGARRACGAAPLRDARACATRRDPPGRTPSSP